ncbi:amino acid ABC transporter permease [Thiocystis minor]|uniref:ABC transporter permease/substrate-binding protein n=1 Tax=Thiocystis minor TaxID=61597 RepID=UPI001914A76C|nr:glycine betaine ABC transporter substrate-binding protein [Thiocystis minor]MBK5965081.1 amino acid ABC transporter permease [Thiocystis minor]
MTARRAWAFLGVLSALMPLLAGCGRTGDEVVIGSKKFTESVVLGEVLKDLVADSGTPVRHRRALGGSRILFNALANGEIDAYVEYTGTLTHEILARSEPQDEAALVARLATDGIRMAGSIGFQNNFALGIPESRAAALGVASISDLKAHPDLRLRFGSEFMDRADGWPGLRDVYGLPQRDVRGVEHELAYRALGAGDADVTEVYTTDAEIAAYDLRTLVDDQGYFPRYDAVLLYRADLEQRSPLAVAALRRSLGLIDAERMIALNAAVKIDGRAEAEVAADWLRTRFDLAVAAPTEGRAARLLRYTLEHAMLVGVSLLAAVVVAVPLGILAAYRRRLGQSLLALVGILQTIPALALLVVMIPFLGIGAGPALVALFLYSLLPIVRNTHAGLVGIPATLRESADALGLSAGARLWRIELPLALPTLLAGIKTAAVINIGAATLGALIGAGGYGQPILAGIRLDDTGLILEGAIPSALFALAAQWFFERAERAAVPRGIRG